MDDSTLITRSEIWRVLQEHRTHHNLLGEGKPWDEVTASAADLLKDQETLNEPQLAELLGVSTGQVQDYLGNVRSRTWQKESRINGIRTLTIFAVGVGLSFLIFVAFMMSVPKTIDGEPAPLMEGKPRDTSIMGTRN